MSRPMRSFRLQLRRPPPRRQRSSTNTPNSLRRHAPARHFERPDAVRGSSSLKSLRDCCREVWRDEAHSHCPLRWGNDMEDLVPEEAVVTITRDGFAKRTCTDHYRSQKQVAARRAWQRLRGDDVVEHFVTTTHHWLLFFSHPKACIARRPMIPGGRSRRQGQHRRESPGLPA